METIGSLIQTRIPHALSTQNENISTAGARTYGWEEIGEKVYFI